MNDPLIHKLVDLLTQQIDELKLTPSEIRECAVLAAINHERRRLPQYFAEQNGHIAQQAEVDIT